MIVFYCIIIFVPPVTSSFTVHRSWPLILIFCWLGFIFFSPAHVFAGSEFQDLWRLFLSLSLAVVTRLPVCIRNSLTQLSFSISSHKYVR